MVGASINKSLKVMGALVGATISDLKNCRCQAPMLKKPQCIAFKAPQLTHEIIELYLASLFTL